MARDEQGPPDTLHIYCIEGVIPEKAEIGLGEAFLGNWVEADYSFLFFREASEERVCRLVGEWNGLRMVDSYCLSYEDWQGDRFERLNVGPFEILPCWNREGTEASGSTCILLDPGVVFGSGLHPTTRDCLKALGWIWGRDDPKGILDLGTGTGILAIGGVLLGAEQAVAVDLNPLCVRTAEKNARLNGLHESIRTVHGPAEKVLEENGEVITANIPYEVMIRLLESTAFQRRRWFVLSGLMRSQVRDVKHRLLKLGIETVREWDQDMVWHTLVARGRAFR